VLRQDRDLVLTVPEKEAFSRDPEYLESHFLPELRRLLPDHTLLLTFDEFDNLEEAEIRESLGRPLVEYFRRLMDRPGLNFIFSIGSSGRKLENMQASYTEFFKAALYKKVSFLEKQDAQALVTRPAEGVLEYEPRAVERILQIASGHPYFTQLTCHELFARCQRTGAKRIGPDVHIPDLATDARFATIGERRKNQQLMWTLITKFAEQYTKRELMAILNPLDVPCGPIMSTADLANDDHVRGRDMWVELDHPQRGKWWNVGMPIKLSASPAEIRRSPTLGEHTDEILQEVLGYDEAKVGALKAAGAFSAPPKKAG